MIREGAIVIMIFGFTVGFMAGRLYQWLDLGIKRDEPKCIWDSENCVFFDREGA